jgi:hypothetical protein
MPGSTRIQFSDLFYRVDTELTEAPRFEASDWSSELGGSLSGWLELLKNIDPDADDFSLDEVPEGFRHLLSVDETEASDELLGGFLFGDSLFGFLNDDTAAEALAARWEAFDTTDTGSVSISSTSTSIQMVHDDGYGLRITGESLSADLRQIITDSARGNTVADSLFEGISGYLTEVMLFDEADTESVQMGFTFKNTDTDKSDAEWVSFEIDGMTVRLDGSFPRDLGSFVDWADQGLDLNYVLVTEGYELTGFSFSFPNHTPLSVSESGASVSVPYYSTDDPDNGTQRYLRAVIEGGFESELGLDSWGGLDLGLTASPTLTRLALEDVKGATVQHAIELTLSGSQWQLRADDIALRATGSLTNDFERIDTMAAADELVPSSVVLRVLSLNKDLVTVTPGWDGSVAGETLSEFDEVHDYSAVASGVITNDGVSMIGTGHDDVLWADWNGHVIDGGAGDDVIGVRYGYIYDQDAPRLSAVLNGGAGADLFHIAAAVDEIYDQTSTDVVGTSGYKILDFDPAVDSIVINPLPYHNWEPLVDVQAADGILRFVFLDRYDGSLIVEDAVELPGLTAAEIEAAMGTGGDRLGEGQTISVGDLYDAVGVESWDDWVDWGSSHVEGDHTFFGSRHAEHFVGDEVGQEFRPLFGPDYLECRGGDDLVRLASGETWGAGNYALNAGSVTVQGTGELIALSGMARYQAVVDGGQGADTLVFSGHDDAVFLDDIVTGRHQNAWDLYDTDVSRLLGIERIELGAGDDLLDMTSALASSGRGASIMVNAGDGNDTVWGGVADETIDGGDGDDLIQGGAGSDVLTGGQGADVFGFTRTSGSDVVTDFEAGVDGLLFYAVTGVDGGINTVTRYEGVVRWGTVSVDLGDGLDGVTDLADVVSFEWI